MEEVKKLTLELEQRKKALETARGALKTATEELSRLESSMVNAERGEADEIRQVWADGLAAGESVLKIQDAVQVRKSISLSRLQETLLKQRSSVEAMRQNVTAARIELQGAEKRLRAAQRDASIEQTLQAQRTFLDALSSVSEAFERLTQSTVEMQKHTDWRARCEKLVPDEDRPVFTVMNDSWLSSARIGSTAGVRVQDVIESLTLSTYLKGNRFSADKNWTPVNRSFGNVQPHDRSEFGIVRSSY